MRKFLTLFLAFVALAIWTAPSYAEVSFGGQYLLRTEWRDNLGFIDASDEDALSECGESCPNQETFYAQRVRLWGIANPTDDTTVKITLQDTRLWGGEMAPAGGPSLTDNSEDAGANDTDLHEAYLQINNFFGTPVAIKMGRQELAYGDERLVGSFGWSANGRSFDAVKFMYGSDQFDVDFWTSKILETGAPAYAADDDQDFYGIYGTLKTIPNNTLDLYVLYLRDGSDCNFVANSDTLTLGTCGSINDQNLWTFGARLKGAVAGVDYTVEVPFQTGQIEFDSASGSDADISAWAWAARAGYTIPSAPMGLRVGAEYVFASGDDDPADGDVETFSNLFPTNHSHLGYMDQQGWRNVAAWNLNVSAKPIEKLSARLDYWDFSLAEEEDAWYAAGNWMNTPTTLFSSRLPCSTCDDEVGQEIDLTVNYAYNKAVSIQAGYSTFLAGDHIEDYYDGSGIPVEDMDWAYLMFVANF